MEKNRGLSLVELLITIAIVSIVMVVAMSFMMTGSRSFTKGNADSTVQKEAELTVNQIEDMIIDINGGVSMTDDANKTEMMMYHTEDDGSGSGNLLYTKEAVTWNKSDNNVYCSKWRVNYDDSTGTYAVDTSATDNYADQLLAENVTSFDVDLSDTLTTKALDGTTRTIVKSVLVKVGYDDGTGIVNYATSPVITLRNRMLLSDDPADIFDEVTPAADTLKLYYTGDEITGIVPIVDRVSEVNRGDVYSIYAKINTGADVNDLVDWEIEEAGTLSTIDASGILSVGTYEANAYLTITARYKSNPSKKATGVVKVVGGDNSKSLKSVSIATLKLDAFAPQYEAFPVTVGFTPDEINAITYKWTVKVEGAGRELSDVVNPFTDNNKKLALSIIKDEANYGKKLVITVEAHSDATGETRWDTVNYLIDKNGDADGDSYMQRGKLEHGEIFFSMSKRGTQDATYTYEYYFCNENGDRISAYDSLLDCIQLTPHGTWGDTYQFAFTEGLPLNQEFYVKVICYYEGYVDGLKVNWTCERIHYIPAVRLFGGTIDHNPVNAYTRFVFEYTLVGYYGGAWANSNPPVYEYEVVDFDYEAPAGIVLTPKIEATIFKNDTTIRTEGSFDCSGGEKWQVQSIKSLTLRVSAKNEPSINTLVTINFKQ